MQLFMPFMGDLGTWFDGQDLSAPPARFELPRTVSDVEAAQMWFRGACWF
jgi:hypothetical protein